MKKSARIDFQSSYISEPVSRTVVTGNGVSPTVVEPTSDWTEPISRGESRQQTADQQLTQVASLYQGEETQSVRAVVGWLVCIKGPDKGRDFRLHGGWNYIGRDPSLEVAVSDLQVSRQQVVKVAYENRGRSFVVAPCEGAKDIAYCCNKPLYHPCELKAMDTISVGESDLLFMPLCGEHFVWDEEE